MILQGVPFARRLGKPAVNGLGEPVKYPLSARFTRAQSIDPVWRELGRLNVGVYPGQMVHNGERLDQPQLSRVAELSGPKIRTMIESLMANPRWSELPDEAEGMRPDKKKVLADHREAKNSRQKHRDVRALEGIVRQPKKIVDAVWYMWDKYHMQTAHQRNQGHTSASDLGQKFRALLEDLRKHPIRHRKLGGQHGAVLRACRRSSRTSTQTNPR